MSASAKQKIDEKIGAIVPKWQPVVDDLVISLDDLDPATIVLEKPQEDKNGFRIPIKRTREDGKKVKLIIEGAYDEKNDNPNSWSFSLGVKVWQGANDKRTMSFFLYDKDGAKPYQNDWVHFYQDKIIDTLIRALLAIKKDIKRPKLTAQELNNETFTRLKMLEKDGKPVAPVFNTNIHDFVKGGLFINTWTHVFQWTTSKTRDYPEVPVTDLINVACRAKFEVLIESIYVGRSISIQTKVERLCFKPEPKLERKMHFGHIGEIEEEPEEEKSVDIPVSDD
jgi:Protein of unknown function (DUF2738)